MAQSTLHTSHASAATLSLSLAIRSADCGFRSAARLSRTARGVTAGLALAGLLACGTAAFAAQAADAATPDAGAQPGAAPAAGDEFGSPDTWHFTVIPVIGATGFKGNGAIGDHAGRLKMPMHKVAKDTRFAIAGGVEAGRGPYGMWLNGQYLDLSHHATLGSDHGELHAKAYATQASLGGYWQAWSGDLGGSTVHGTPQRWVIAPLAGVRMTHLKATVDDDKGSASRSATWAIPMAGARMSMDLSPRWLVSAEADAGAWGRRFTTQGQLFAGYRLAVFGQPAVLQVGYQVHHEDYEKQDFHWNVTQYGPVAGLAVTF